MYQTETIIALGSNLGNAIFNLRCAVRELKNIGNIKKFANIYVSSPYGYKSQSNFFNTAIKLLTNQQPLELINNIYEIEKKLKKNKKNYNSNSLARSPILAPPAINLFTSSLPSSEDNPEPITSPKLKKVYRSAIRRA